MTFYFYDLETSGLSASAQRIMQFAGQRTDEDFNAIGEPHNWLIRLTDEILPDPDAVLLTGITPQQTLAEGLSEADFLKEFTGQVLQPDTVIAGFNNIRFDDEFMRYTLWRNFYDPYEWQWADGRSRWDLLDVARMIRALRPDGITWPVDAKKQPTNRLELLAAANNLTHDHAHDALSDVHATIAFAKLLKQHQPKMFSYLKDNCSKQAVTKLVDLHSPQPLVYTSSSYSSQWQKTTVVYPVGEGSHKNVLVFDLRHDPQTFIDQSDEELETSLFNRLSDSETAPVKTLRLNTCPSIAPLGVLDERAQTTIGLNLETIEKHYRLLRSQSKFMTRIQKIYEKVEASRRASFEQHPADSDFQLYDGFIDSSDLSTMRAIRAAAPEDISGLTEQLKDERLKSLAVKYQARNHATSLSDEERKTWEAYRQNRLTTGVRGQLSMTEYAQRLASIAASKHDSTSQYLLEELQLYAESIIPIEY